jgi:hypothetical protein
MIEKEQVDAYMHVHQEKQIMYSSSKHIGVGGIKQPLRFF